MVAGDEGPASLQSTGSADALTESRDGAGARRSSCRSQPGLVALFPRLSMSAPRTWHMSGSTLVGRGRESLVRLKDGRVSRSHAMVEPRGGGLFVRDLDSRHGSFVDGGRVGPSGKLARIGSIIRVGDTLLLAVDDVRRYDVAPRTIEGALLGLRKPVIAGPLLADVWDLAARLAHREDPVLILGETGSGKECIARIIHAHAPRNGAFVGVNVAAVPDTLFEAELFGHEKGAFTGATNGRLGAFSEASDGVLFLDEVGDLKPELQVKLLRALDLGRVRPLGASRDVTVTARVVSATSRDLEIATKEGRFRADLRYRLSALVIQVPPLRARRDDVALLTMQLLSEESAPPVSADAMEMLLLARWEGNARELRHVLLSAAESARVAGAGEVRPEHLPALTSFSDQGRELTESAIREAMLKSGGVILRAAKLLGVSRTTLYKALAHVNVGE